MARISILRIDSQQAYKIWVDSPYATVFSHPDVLVCAAFRVDWFAVKRGEEVLCVWPICLNKEGKSYIPPFFYYVGPIWSRNTLDIPQHRMFSVRLNVYEKFLSEFESLYSGVCASLPIGLDDVRAFDWWNYHSHDKERITIKPRYTAIIGDLQNICSPELNYREVRRQELRKTISSELYCIDNTIALNDVLNLYMATLDRQGINVSDETERLIVNVFDLIQRGFGEILVVREKSALKKPLFVSLMLRSRGICNLVINATNVDARRTGVPTLGVHSSIVRAKNLGDSVFDFNGANSPNRGDDKHSYGANAVLYFDINYFV